VAVKQRYEEAVNLFKLKGHEIMSAPYIALLFLMVIYIEELYFFTATASLRNSYQPGIEELHRFFDPNYISLVMLLTVAIIKHPWWMSLTKMFFIGALISCFALGLFESLYQGAAKSWVLPEDRTLSDTIESSLIHPTFSGRSTARSAFCGIVAFIALGITIFLERHRHNQALHREDQ